jgi:glycosyltransferase involved in cell wall biosynthesis
MLRKKIVIVASDLYCVRGFLTKQIELVQENYAVTLVVNADLTETAALVGSNVELRNFNLQRKISFFKDLASLFNLVKFLVNHQPDIVHSITPKAGLIAMLAAKIAGIRFRMHTFTGQVWQTKTGFMRYLLLWADKITSACASVILADSHSQLKFLIESGVVSAKKSAVLAQGSICGVDAVQFKPNHAARLSVREKLNIDDDAILFLYMARFTVDKGAISMAKAFARLTDCLSVKHHLLMIGPDEENLSDEIKLILKKSVGRFTLLNYTDTPEAYFQACDVFCLPSFREGLPMVLLNAAACEIPAVASRIYGCTDAVVDGETGFLFEAGHIEQLSALLQKLALDQDLRLRAGKAARQRIEKDFTNEKISTQLLRLYAEQSLVSCETTNSMKV